MDVLLDWLDQRAKYKKDCQVVQDAFDAQNRCGEYLGIEFSDDPENTNITTTLPLNERKDEINRNNPLIKVSTQANLLILILKNHL
jgi:hypothetical protein